MFVHMAQNFTIDIILKIDASYLTNSFDLFFLDESVRFCKYHFYILHVL